MTSVCIVGVCNPWSLEDPGLLGTPTMSAKYVPYSLTRWR